MLANWTHSVESVLRVLFVWTIWTEVENFGCEERVLGLMLVLGGFWSLRMPGPVAMENGHAAGESVMKSKKVKVMDPMGEDVAVAASPLAPESEKKKTKKGKKVEAEVSKSKKKRLKSPEDDGAAAKKIQKVVENGGKEAGAPVDLMAMSNFNICKVLSDKLKSKGIESLFPIQAQTFDAVFTRNDMVGRVRTGQVGLRASFHGTLF